MKPIPLPFLVAAFVLALALPRSAAAAADGGSRQWTQLAQRADAVALGVCEHADSAWDADQRLIVTTAQFRVARYFKGAAGSTVTVKILGGRVGSDGMAASQGATLRTGEDAVLFLRRSAFGPYFVVWGGSSGKVAVQGDVFSTQQTIGGRLTAEAFGRLIDGAATP